MAEQVNQRLEDMINELEQMRRTTLYNEDEIKEISRKRKDFEYQLQRYVKRKEDYVQYIAYEMALLEDISTRRKMAKMTEKKKDIEYAIAKRVNKVFKQFIYRFQNDVEIYFEYLKFCKSVGFNTAASGIIGQMLQMHGDKPKMWQLASKWESEEQKNLEGAKVFLLKGLQRHPEAEDLYLELFKTELLELTFSTDADEEKEKLLKRADIVWRNGLKNVDEVSLLFNCLDLVLKYDVVGMKNGIKSEIWARKDRKDVWLYIAVKELEGVHWEEIEVFAEENSVFPKVLNYCIGVFEEALTQFPDPNICKKYIHTLLGLDESICDGTQKINAVKRAWRSGHKRSVLSDDIFAFGVEILKLEGEMSDDDLWKLLEEATVKNSTHRSIWEQKILLCKSDEKKMMEILEEGIKVLKAEDSVYLYNLMIDNVESNLTLKDLLKRFQSCENKILLAVKPKLLQKMYDHNGLPAARELYEDLIRTPPVQLEVDMIMINIESAQKVPDPKRIRRYYESAIQHHGATDPNIWNEFIEFELVYGETTYEAPNLYRRALATLNDNIVDKFVLMQCVQRTKPINFYRKC